MNERQEIAGTVWAVFGHRLAVEGAGGRFLADLGPKGGAGFEIAVGDEVTLEGTRKPTEIKVTSIALNGGTVRGIVWPNEPEHEAADPSAAIAAVEAEGFAVEGEPKRTPKHFEIVGSKGGTRHELHVAFDGAIRRTKPLAV